MVYIVFKCDHCKSLPKGLTLITKIFTKIKKQNKTTMKVPAGYNKSTSWPVPVNPVFWEDEAERKKVRAQLGQLRL